MSCPRISLKKHLSKSGLRGAGWSKIRREQTKISQVWHLHSSTCYIFIYGNNCINLFANSWNVYLSICFTSRSPAICRSKKDINCIAAIRCILFFVRYNEHHFLKYNAKRWWYTVCNVYQCNSFLAVDDNPHLFWHCSLQLRYLHLLDIFDCLYCGTRITILRQISRRQNANYAGDWRSANCTDSGIAGESGRIVFLS